jgi:Uma2 family endonuclease
MNMPAVQFPKGISYEDFLASADEDTHAEWVDGEVVPLNPPSKRHIRITAFLITVLRTYAGRTKLGEVLHAPVYMKLRSSARQPDVVFIAAENLHRWGEQGVDGPVDLAIEVISPDSRVRDRKEKFREYEQAGVREYWIVDPLTEQAEVYRLSGGGTYELMPPGDPPRLTSEVMPGLWIDPAWLWAEAPDEWTAFRAWGLL